MTRRRLALIDGLFGVLIGAFSLAWVSASSPVTRRAAEHLPGFGTQVFAGSSALYMILFGIPMFLATAALAPALIDVLRRWSSNSPARYYAKAALAGIVFGVPVSAAVGFTIGLLVPFLPSPPGDPTTLSQRGLALIGAPMLLSIGAALLSLFLLPQVVVTGVAFGLWNAWAVRRLSR